MTPTEVLNEIRKMPPTEKRAVFRALNEQLNKGQPNGNGGSQTLGGLINDCFGSVAADVMDKLPEDASINLDQYLYGAPKK